MVEQLLAQHGEGVTMAWHARPGRLKTRARRSCHRVRACRASRLSGNIRGYIRLELHNPRRDGSKKTKKNKKMLKMKVDPDELLKNKSTKIVICREPDELLKIKDLSDFRMSH
jgi:hypothetical protein